MNGVRRLLGAAQTSSPPTLPNDPISPSPSPPPNVLPLSFGKPAPTWPPSSPAALSSPASQYSPAPDTPSLFIAKKDRQSRPNPDTFPIASRPYSPSSTPSRQSAGPVNPSSSRSPPVYPAASPTRAHTMPNSPVSGPSRKSVNTDLNWKRSSPQLNTRDELLMSLMASEAVIDSREFEILSAEDVESLKKEHQVLSSRLGALNKKLALETKIRDAALSLSKVNASHKSVSKQTSEQLDAANKRVESAQKELWKVSDRVNEVHRRLMEHRAGVLSFSVRNLEKKMSGNHEDSGYDSSNRSTLTSPVSSSMTGVSGPSKARFDGAHLFAGHADAVVPRQKLSPEAAAAELQAMEDKLSKAKEQLAAASKKQASLTRELALMRLEKQEVETVMGMDLQAAEETIAALEKEIPRLEAVNEEVQTLRQEKSVWMKERQELDLSRTRLRELESKSGSSAGLERVLEATREKLAQTEAELQQVRDEWDDDRAHWEQERQQLEDEKLDDLARLQEEMDRTQGAEARSMQQSNDDLSAGLAALQDMIKTHGIVLFSRDSSLPGLLTAIGQHIATVHTKLEAHSKLEAEWEATRRKLEGDIRTGFDKRESLARELEESRREAETARRDTLTIRAAHLRTPSIPNATLPLEDGDLTVAKILGLLLPLWQVLPSPEARAAKFGGNNSRAFRTGSPASPGGAISAGANSLSELDVRSLKTLYDPRGVNGATTPTSPKPGSGPFTIEAFAQRVQALINDDKALIERLVRFAQAHDLLKKNAERAQKLAQDGNSALETYQKQVKMLEERNASLSQQQGGIQDELNLLHDTIERLTNEKRELESLAAEQAQQCEQLTEANNTLSARTLTLAEEAAIAPELIRKQLEGQLYETKKALDAAEDELNAMRTAEQTQRIALLDELNSMQTENGNLRNQLRALKQ